MQPEASPFPIYSHSVYKYPLYSLPRPKFFKYSKVEQYFSQRAEIESAIRHQEEWLCRQRLREYQQQLRFKIHRQQMVSSQRLFQEAQHKQKREQEEERLGMLNYLERLDRLAIQRLQIAKQQAKMFERSYLEDSRQRQRSFDLWEKQRRLNIERQNMAKRIDNYKRGDQSQTFRKFYQSQNEIGYNFKELNINSSREDRKINFTNDTINSNFKNKQKGGDHDKTKKSSNDTSLLSYKYRSQQKRNRVSRKKGKPSKTVGKKRKNLDPNSKSLLVHKLDICNFEKKIGLKKIQNRIRNSAIVFHDSRWKNQRHELRHLFNTFDIQERVRKQVKDKINNNPIILKKHALVIESR